MNDNLSQSMQCLTPEGRVRYFEEFLPLLHNTMFVPALRRFLGCAIC